MLAFKLLLALALVGVACAFMGRLPSSTRSRGHISASLEELERKALSKNLGVQSKSSTSERQKGFSLFGGSSASSPAKTTVKASPSPAKNLMASKTVKVSKEVAKAVAPATVMTKVKPVTAVQVPSAPVVSPPSGADFGTAGIVGGALLATVAGASAVTNALTGRAKAIAAAEQKKAIEAAARAEYLRQQRARKPLAPGPADGVRLAISAAAIVASAGIFGVAVLAPQAPEAPAPVTKEIKKAAPAAPAPAPKVEAPKPAAPAPAPPAPKAEAPTPAPVPEAPKAEAPKAAAPAAPATEAIKPAPEAPKVEAPKVEAPKVEAPKVEAPKAEAPKPVEVAKPKVEAAKPAPAPAAAPSSVAGDAPTARALPADNAVDPEFLKSLKGSKKGKK